MTEKLSVGIADAEKGTNEIKELTGVELDAHLAAQAQAQASEQATLDKITAKAAQRQLLLDRLGITQEEAQLLLGGIN
jgi:hypothetical protein